MREMNLEAVDNLFDEMQEVKYTQDEFTDAMSKNYEIEVDEASFLQNSGGGVG